LTAVENAQFCTDVPAALLLGGHRHGAPLFTLRRLRHTDVRSTLRVAE
jgi:hypothetical protein